MKAVVLGIGNPNFGDDGVGEKVVKKLKDKVVSYHLLSPSFELIEKIKGFQVAFLVDAVDFGLEPGKVVKKLFKKGEAEHRYGGPTHTLSMEEIITTGYELFEEEMPQKVFLLGVQVEDVSPRKGLSEKVEKGVEEVVEEIEKILLNLQDG